MVRSKYQYFFNNAFIINIHCMAAIAVPAGGAGRAISPPSFEDLGKIKIFRQNHDFLGSDTKNLGKVRKFREVTMRNCKK